MTLFQEIDSRSNAGLEVSLLWTREGDRLSVHVFDTQSNDSFEIAVTAENAREVFDHPFVYA
jgi:hypothetical protein